MQVDVHFMGTANHGYNERILDDRGVSITEFDCIN